MYSESGSSCNVNMMLTPNPVIKYHINMMLTPNPVIKYQRKQRSYTLSSGVSRLIPWKYYCTTVWWATAHATWASYEFLQSRNRCIFSMTSRTAVTAQLSTDTDRPVRLRPLTLTSWSPVENRPLSFVDRLHVHVFSCWLFNNLCCFHWSLL